MAEARRRWTGRCAAALLALGMLGVGCTAARPAPRMPPRAEGPSPVPLPVPVVPTEALLAAHAELLRLEDRREYDEEALTRLARDSSAAVRARTALAVGRLRVPAGAPLLLSLLTDADTAVAATAAFALGQMADSAFAGELAARLTAAVPQAPTVASEAAYALGKVGGAVAQEALRSLLAGAGPADSVVAPAAGAALLAIWKLPRLPALEPIARWLRSPDPELRWRAAYALTRRRDPRAIPALRAALADDDERVRAQAVRGLTASAADSAGVDRQALVADLLPLLDDSSYHLAVNAAAVLGSYDDARVPPALARAAISPSRHLALAAVEALGRVGEAARSASSTLVQVASSDAVPVALRAAAAEALARVDAAQGAVVARRLAASPEWRLRAAAARVFAAAPAAGAAAPSGPLREHLGDPDPRVANAALQAVIDATGDDLLPIRPLLVEQLGAADVIVRATALTGLARAGDAALLPTLLDAFGRAQRDTLNDAALAAIDAIAAVQREGANPTRAFLARFTRPDDALVRQRAVQRLDSAAVIAAWGLPLPIETGRSAADYREVVDRLVAPALTGAPPPQVLIETAGDSIVLRLHAREAPLTVESFLRLADGGFFDGQRWPRVVANFVVQGGDPRGDTSGGPGYTIRDEISRLRYGAGALGMALAGPDTGGSQFFITHSRQPHLDGTYAIFGQMVAGADVAERLLAGDVIESIRSVR